MFHYAYIYGSIEAIRVSYDNYELCRVALILGTLVDLKIQEITDFYTTGQPATLQHQCC